MRTLLALYVFASSFCLMAQKDESLKYYQFGEDSLNLQQYNPAKGLFQKALTLHPKASFIHFALGNSYLGLNQYDSAICHFQQAIFYDSNQLSYSKSIASTYIKMKDYNKALPYLELVNQKEKTNDTVLLQLAICDYQSTQYQNAISRCKTTLVLNPKQVLAYRYLGYSYFAIQNYREALEAFNKLLLFDPLNADVINLMGLCYGKLEQPLKAKERFEEAKLLSPDNFEISLNLAESRLQANDFLGARSIYLGLEPQFESKEDIWFYLGNTYFNEKKNDSAIYYYEKIIVINRQYTSCYTPLAAAYLNTKNFSKAIEYYEELQKVTNTAPINNYIGLAYLGLNNYLKAKDFFKQAILIDKNMGIAYLNLGKIYQLLNEPEEAISQLKAAQLLLPNDVDVYSALAKTYTLNGDYEKAIKNYQLLQEIKPKKSIDYILVDLFYQNKEFNQAFLLCKKLILDDSTNTALYYKMGLCFDGEKKYNEAITMYVQMLKFDEKDKNSLMAIANDYFLLEEYKNSLWYLDLALAQDSNFAKAYYLMGYIKYNLGKIKESKELFVKAALIDPKYTIPDFVKK